MTIEVSIVESLSLSDSVDAALVPGNQARDWKQRWKLLQDELLLILRPHTETLSGESIHVALQRLFSFFISAYHLKDALKDAGTGIGLSPSDVEDAISSDARLALLADLANLDKHMKLTRAPRSGAVPVIGEVSGSDDPQGGGWRLSVQITHGTRTLEGLAVAQDSVNAWRDKLAVWGLI